MAKHVPNILSALRILLSVLLIPLMSADFGFVMVYVAIGITDILDGFIARKLGCESHIGARLDSIADFVFFSTFVYLFLSLYSPIIVTAHLVVLIAIIAVRLANMLFTKLKYKKVVFVHTLANKAAGFALYFMPIVLLLAHNGIVIWIISIIVLGAAIEELLITIRYKEPDLNRTSIFASIHK